MKKLLLPLLLLPFAAFAHEGHGHTDGYTIIHYITEPLHLAITALVLALTATLVVRRRRSRKKNL